MRAAFFQFGVNKSRFERYLMHAFKVLSQCTFSPVAYNEQRAAKSLERFLALGAESKFIKPSDGQAQIHMLRIDAEDLEDRIRRFGAYWEKIKIVEEGAMREVLAIRLPKDQTPEWKAFEENLLWLKWKKQPVILADSNALCELIITCERAESIEKEDWYKKLFLNVTIPNASCLMLPRLAGYYLGLKQNICFYDSRGKALSTGIPSEAGYYNDIMAVYHEINDTVDPKNLWLSGTCGGSLIAGYLKARLHKEGVNFLSENGALNLQKDWFDIQPWPTNYFARYFSSGLESRDIPAELKPIETKFNNEKLWNLPYSEIGKVLVIFVDNDQRIGKDVAEKMVACARKINRHVHSIGYHSVDKDPHSDTYIRHPDVSSKALAFIFA